MGHSTGVKNRLNRKGFYENDKFNYGREELVAELISALSGVYLGISVTVREENAAYLKSWCKAIKEEPKFLFTVLADAIKGSKFIAQHLNIRLDVEEVEEEKIQRLLKGSFPLGEFFFKRQKNQRLNRFTLLRSNSFAISKPTHPSKVCFYPSAILSKVPLPFR